MPRQKRNGNPARRRDASDASVAANRVAIAQEKLLQLEQHAPPFSLAYFGVEPQWVTDDLDQPLTGETYLHSQDRLSGRIIHLASSHRGATMTAASRGFTLPFIAVPRWQELPMGEDIHTVVTAGVDWTSKPTQDGLRIIQAVRRMARLHFSAMIGLDSVEREYAPASRAELRDLVMYVSARIELEITIASEPYRRLALSLDRDGWLATQLR